jgi:hypothetical protein
MMDKYTMKDILESMGNISRAASTSFTSLDLTSGFWQMPLHATSFQKQRSPCQDCTNTNG